MVRSRLGGPFGIVLAAAFGATACGGGGGLASGDTSVFLTVKNGSGAMAPEVVVIEVHDENGGATIGTLSRSAAAPNGDFLGDITIYTPEGVSSVRFVAWGLVNEVAVSTGETGGVAINPNKQVTATVTLNGIPPGTDTGPVFVPDAAVLDAPVAGEDAPMAEDAPMGVDTPPLADGAPLRMLGESCNNRLECQSNFCVESVCCDMACQGLCLTCKPPDAGAGTCTPRPAGFECAAARCSGNKKQLQLFSCDSQALCQQMNLNCPASMCEAATKTCQ